MTSLILQYARMFAKKMRVKIQLHHKDKGELLPSLGKLKYYLAKIRSHLTSGTAEDYIDVANYAMFAFREVFALTDEETSVTTNNRRNSVGYVDNVSDYMDAVADALGHREDKMISDALTRKTKEEAEK